MGVTGLYQHKHDRTGMHPGSPEERGRRDGGLHVTGGWGAAEGRLSPFSSSRSSEWGVGDSKVSDNRTQNQGGVEGSWPEQASIGAVFQLGKSLWGHSCRWETPPKLGRSPWRSPSGCHWRRGILPRSLKTFLDRAQHKKLRGLPAPDQLGPG